MSTWRIPTVSYNGEDSEPIESETFEGLLAGVERRGMEFGVSARRQTVWEAFSSEDIAALEAIVADVAGDPESDHPFVEDAKRLARQIEIENRRRTH